MYMYFSRASLLPLNGFYKERKKKKEWKIKGVLCQILRLLFVDFSRLRFIAVEQITTQDSSERFFNN